jgi:hypothetical protein
LAIDGLDPIIPDTLVSAKILLARQHFRERHPEKARQVLDELDELTVPGSDHFLRSRWAIRLRRGLLEEWHGDKRQAVALLGEARAASLDPAVYCLLAVIGWDLHAPRSIGSNRFVAEFEKTCRVGGTIVQAALLLRLHAFMQRMPVGSALHGAERLIGAHLRRVAARRDYTREDVQRLFDLIPPGSPFEYDLQPFVQTILKQDDQDPLFRIYQRRFGWFDSSGPEEDRSQLQEILEEAIRRRDDQAIQLARKELGRLDAPPPVPLLEEPGFTDPPDFSQDNAPDLEDAIAWTPALEQVIELLRGASEAEIRRLRKTMPKEIPKAMFDVLLNAARGERPLPPLPPLPDPKKTTPSRPHRPAARPSPPSDPNQLDLF